MSKILDQKGIHVQSQRCVRLFAAAVIVVLSSNVGGKSIWCCAVCTAVPDSAQATIHTRPHPPTPPSRATLCGWGLPGGTACTLTSRLWAAPLFRSKCEKMCLVLRVASASQWSGRVWCVCGPGTDGRSTVRHRVGRPSSVTSFCRSTLPTQWGGLFPQNGPRQSRHVLLPFSGPLAARRKWPADASGLAVVRSLAVGDGHVVCELVGLRDTFSFFFEPRGQTTDNKALSLLLLFWARMRPLVAPSNATGTVCTSVLTTRLLLVDNTLCPKNTHGVLKVLEVPFPSN